MVLALQDCLVKLPVTMETFRIHTIQYDSPRGIVSIRQVVSVTEKLDFKFYFIFLATCG